MNSSCSCGSNHSFPATTTTIRWHLQCTDNNNNSPTFQPHDSKQRQHQQKQRTRSCFFSFGGFEDPIPRQSSFFSLCDWCKLLYHVILRQADRCRCALPVLPLPALRRVGGRRTSVGMARWFCCCWFCCCCACCRGTFRRRRIGKCGAAFFAVVVVVLVVFVVTMLV